MVDPATRRLAAICFADIVGYTTLASTHEDAALRLVRLFQDVVRAGLEPFGGRLTKFLGDGVLLEFSSADGALRAALSLEREFARRASEIGFDTLLRIGVHVGEVTIGDDGDLYGDGINIASRLHGLAGPGQVIVSDDVRRLLRGRPEYRLKPLGRRQIRGIAQAIDVYAVDEVGPVRRRAGLLALRDSIMPHAARDPAAAGGRLRSASAGPTRQNLAHLAIATGVAAAAITAFFLVPGGRPDVSPGTTAAILAAVLVVVLIPLAMLSVLRRGAVSRRDATAQIDEATPWSSAPVDEEDFLAPLPSAGTAFIGRSAELRQLAELLSSSNHRLITIVGTGGAGKTRLAVQAARIAASAFRDGVAYVALSSLPSRQLLPQALAHALGVSLSRREDTLAELLEFLHSKQMLLLLDNFDELIGEAAVLATILEHAAGVRMLVTTRERLNLMDETLVSLQGLDSRGADSDAVQLFLAAARRHDGSFTADAAGMANIERICTLVGGMPLALELAAAWVRVLSCDEIRAEVERGLDILAITSAGAPSRHRSMRVIFDASWRLLSPAEQQAAARLAVLRSPFDRHTAAAVAEVDVVVLRALLDKSMLARSGGRFLMLEVMRQYALEQLALDAQDERGTRVRHVQVFTDLLLRLAPALARCEPDALTRVDDAIDEIRAAWLFAVRAKDAASLLRAVDALFHFYDARGWIREALDTFDSAARVFDATGTDVPGDDDARVRTSLAARLDVRRGVLHSRMGELDRAEALLLRGASAARGLGDSREAVFALNRLGANRLLAGRYDDAAAAHGEARKLAEAAGDRHATGWSLTHLGNLAWTRGEYDAATRYYTEALEILREHHDRSGMWTAVNNLGAIAFVQKDYEQARRRFSEGVALQRELRNQRSTAMLLHNLGCVDMAAGDHDSARGHLLEALAISERMGYQRMSALSLVGMADLSLREGDFDGAGTALKRALQLAAAANNQPVSLEALLGMARLRARQGDGMRAAQLARIVVQHPASEQDARTKARQLLEEVASTDDVRTDVAAAGPPIFEHGESDLEQLIASLLEREPAPVDP